jgi:hypothetical protein
LTPYDAELKQLGPTMTHIPAADSHSAPITTPQSHHRKAADLHEKAVKHHRQAARLLDAGDEQQAQTHANIAHRHAMSALETADMAETA